MVYYCFTTIVRSMIMDILTLGFHHVPTMPCPPTTSSQRVITHLRQSHWASNSCHVSFKWFHVLYIYIHIVSYSFIQFHTVSYCFMLYGRPFNPGVHSPQTTKAASRLCRVQGQGWSSEMSWSKIHVIVGRTLLRLKSKDLTRET